MLCTNHGSLQWLHSLNEPEGQLARWLEHLQEYEFDIQHQKGSHHQNADALSQRTYVSHILSLVTTEPFPELCEHSFTDLRRLQQEDDTVGLLLTAVKDQKCPVTQGKSRLLL